MLFLLIIETNSGREKAFSSWKIGTGGGVFLYLWILSAAITSAVYFSSVFGHYQLYWEFEDKYTYSKKPVSATRKQFLSTVIISTLTPAFVSTTQDYSWIFDQTWEVYDQTLTRFNYINMKMVSPDNVISKNEEMWDITLSQLLAQNQTLIDIANIFQLYHVVVCYTS